MKKRQKKKWGKVRCPRCRSGSGIWSWGKCRTGRWISYHAGCLDCMLGYEKIESNVEDEIEEEKTEV